MAGPQRPECNLISFTGLGTYGEVLSAPQLDLEAKRAWFKIDFSTSKRGLVQNFTEIKSELIPIMGFVPLQFCTV